MFGESAGKFVAHGALMTANMFVGIGPVKGSLSKGMCMPQCLAEATRLVSCLSGCYGYCGSAVGSVMDGPVTKARG